MAVLTIRQAAKRFGLPHKIFVNGSLLCVMNTPEARFQLPEGQHQVEIRSMIPIIRSMKYVSLSEEKTTLLEFKDREKIWDLIFWGDMALWLAKVFLHLQKPYSTIYEIVSDTVFAVWLLHEWRIRNVYFDIDVTHIENGVTNGDGA